MCNDKVMLCAIGRERRKRASSVVVVVELHGYTKD